MHYWLMKNDAGSYSIDDFSRERKTHWEGVRNFQARNILKSMQTGDKFIFYLSNADPSGIAGVGKIIKSAYPDETQFDSKSEYFDKRASREKPIWFRVDVAFEFKFPRVTALSDLKKNKKLKGNPVLLRGQRLSVMPITESHFKEMVRVGESG